MQMTAEIRIRVPADKAWQLVGTRFGEIASWAAPIVTSSLDHHVAAVGAVRTCHVQGFGPMGDMVVRERLLAFDDAARSLTYDAVDGMPGFIRRATNRWTVTADGAQGCVARSDVTMRLAWWLRPFAPVMAARLRKEAHGVLEELAHVLATGRPHARKVTSSTAASPTVER
ncbi:SRPBCC family protein [Kineosporia sp. A_224]|uniref:SRPBCC family protein n=1 Tax=Kineosporia sp. A_224 TaxID=1962180 RepID=UPI000B4BB0B4|nr:SRPBCC family protein [Kineosporia sp. A_224]